MIPLSFKQSVSIKDDEIEYIFAPKTGELELAFFDLYKEAGDDWIQRQMAFFDKVVLGWKAPEGLTKFPEDKKPSKICNAQERSYIFTLWHKANTLTIEEKKS